MRLSSITALTGEFDNFSVKRVTDPPSTALRIHTTPTGAGRGWLRADSGFNANLTNLRVIIDKP